MPDNSAVFSAVVSAVREQTTLLLGTTIGFSDEDWAAPSALLGWTRSHVAAHLVQGAFALSRVIATAEQGFSERLYSSEQDKQVAIEIGALASGLELQIGLDTSAGQLQEMLPSLAGDQRLVTLRAGFKLPAHELPLARLSEVTLHHLDLGGPGLDCLEPIVATELLRYHANQFLDREDLALTRLITDEGVEFVVGAGAQPSELRGPAADLLAWLMRRITLHPLARSEPGSG